MKQEELAGKTTFATAHKHNWFTQRRVWILMSMVIIGAGLVLNWNWLQAIGIAPILISVLPCLAMCAAGLCICRGGNTCPKDSANE